MFEDIKKNKIKSGVIVFGFLVFVSLIIYYVCLACDLSGPSAMFIALCFSIFTTGISYYNSDKIILKTSHARPATLEEDRKLVHILEALMVSSGLPHQPGLYVIDSDQPNAFATGRNPEHAIICVTTGLLNMMSYYELEGVIAHEMSHIKNYDILLSGIVSVLLGFVVMLSDIFSRRFFRGSRDNDDNKGSAILMIVGFICLLLAPLLGKIMQLALSRRREFLADATSVEFTRNPDGLISALKKLDSDNHPLDSANNATAHMFIVNPFKSANGERKRASLFSTHPSIDDRIAALQSLE